MTKLIIISAPSGTGKSTLIGRIMSEAPDLRLRFSVSATSRSPRGIERNGVEYYFLSNETFREHIACGDFLEYEEVYNGTYYGTLLSEVDRILDAGDNVLFDVDSIGALNIKAHYGRRALAIFVKPPSPEVLRSRLEGRGTDKPEVIRERLEKATEELARADRFDTVVTNDNLADCVESMISIIRTFLNQECLTHDE